MFPRTGLAVALVLAAATASAQNYTLAPIALRYQAAPGTSSTFWSFEQPISITNQGVAFAANLSSPYDGAHGDAAYTDLGEGLELVALQGAPAPGVPGEYYGGVRFVGLNAGGEVVYRADIGNGSSYHWALYRWADGVTTLLLKSGDAAPLPGHTYYDFTAPAIDDAGTVVFIGQVLDAEQSLKTGIFRLDSGVVTPLVWEYAAAPRLDGGGLVSLGAPVPNAAGDVAFISGVFVPGSGVGNGLFKLSGSELQTLVLEGDVLPGTGGGTADRLWASRIDMNAAGTVAFAAGIVGGSVSRGIFKVSNGVVSPVVLEGDLAPGSAGTIEYLRNNVAIDNAGRVTYLADLDGGWTTGLFHGAEVVALPGDPLPGTGGGQVGVMSEPPDATASGGVGFETGIFYPGAGGRGVFRATPVPEPGRLASLALGSLLALCLRRSTVPRT